MKKIFLALLALALVFSCETETAVGGDAGSAPFPLKGYADRAVFTTYIFGQPAGSIESSIDEDGNYRRVSTTAFAGQTFTITYSLTCDRFGYWTSATQTPSLASNEIRREGGRAVIRKGGEKYGLALPPGHMFFDSGGMVLLEIMLKTYDSVKRGRQAFTCFYEEKVTPLELTWSGDIRLAVNGREREFRIFDAAILGVPFRLWALADGRLAMEHVPMFHQTRVREGYEDLHAALPEEAGVSRSEFKFRRETVPVPMRDGVNLSTDVYLPEAAGRRFPAVLIRTPYGKRMQELTAGYFASRGYAVVVQDCRGCYASEGAWKPFFHEAEDGYDAVEWAGTREWSSGRVGMIGASYVGWTQLWAAAEKPPHLTTIIPCVAPPDPFFNLPYEYGVFSSMGSLWWSQVVDTRAASDLSGYLMWKITNIDFRGVFRDLPLIDADKRAYGWESRHWRAWIEHNTNDSYWEGSNFTGKLKGLSLPVFLQSGWFDGDGIGSKLNYLTLKRSHNRFQKLTIGPWGHADQSFSRLGDRDFTAEAAPDLQIEYLRWFDHWLKGVDNGVRKEPLVRIFVMESNTWLTGDSYPLPETRFTKFYLRSGGHANTSKGDGRLTLSAPAANDGEYDAYRYDPGDPTPWADYYFETPEEAAAEKGRLLSVEDRRRKVESFHNKVTDARRDILVYQTDSLSEPLTIAGPVSAVLHASSSAPDTDWIANLMDVDESGKIFPLVHGVRRARFRNSMSRPEMMESGRVYEFKLDLWQTGITFKKGHRIRLEIASAMFPFFSRNLNTGGNNEKETIFQAAEQKIYHNRTYPSFVLLPVIPPNMPKKK